MGHAPDCRRVPDAPCDRGAQDARAELQHFAYVVSHDLKEPLFGIETYAAVLREDYAGQLDQAGQDLIVQIEGLAARQRAMLEAVHAYARIGAATLAPEDIDMNLAVGDALDALRDSGDLDAIDVRIPVPLGTAHGDPALVSELWRHLILNAARFNDKPVKWIELGRTTDGPGRPVSFYARDNGIGIPEKSWSSIFSMFTRLNRRSERACGAGAGLTLVRRIVERHGGGVSVDSRVGEGSTFSFTLEGGVSA
jgi:light-regulated signal transduction histidine kinase (bacteriophytochrome)